MSAAKHAEPGSYEDIVGSALIGIQRLKKGLPKVEGYSLLSPVPDEEWEDVVRWEVNQPWLEKQGDHDTRGWFAHDAGSEECLALGHAPDPENGWEGDDAHPYGWHDEPICVATRYGVACSVCESDECPAMEKADTRAFWKLFEARS